MSNPAAKVPDSDIVEQEQRWIERIRQGDGAAFEGMFRAYYPSLRRFAAGYVSSPDLSHEVVQDVFLHIWEKHTSWQPTRSLRMYLFQAVRNQALNYRRRESTRRLISIPDSDFPDPEASVNNFNEVDSFQAKELAEAIRDAVEEMPERRRMTFLLHRAHGFSYAEIAEIMEVSQKTVGNQLTEALKFLRERLAPTFR